MLNIFNKKYKACSNLFVTTLEGAEYTFPAPLEVHAMIEDENKNLINKVDFKVSSYLDSILTLDINFSIFAYLLTHDYRLDCVYIADVIKESVSPDSDGYKGTFRFLNENVSMNIGMEEIYDRYVKVRDQHLDLETVTN